MKKFRADMKENQMVFWCIRSSSLKILNVRYLYLSTVHWEAASNTIYLVNHSTYIWFGITKQTKSGRKAVGKPKCLMQYVALTSFSFCVLFISTHCLLCLLRNQKPSSEQRDSFIIRIFRVGRCIKLITSIKNKPYIKIFTGQAV